MLHTFSSKHRLSKDKIHCCSSKYVLQVTVLAYFMIGGTARGEKEKRSVIRSRKLKGEKRIKKMGLRIQKETRY